MKQITVTLNIDENTVKEESGQRYLSDAIGQELGWLRDSGMFVEKWSYVEPKVQVYQQNKEDVETYKESIKYWSNAVGELHRHGREDLTEGELPAELRHAYQDLWTDSYGSRCYLVETDKGYGIALINEYDETFAKDCSISMEQLFESALQDADTIAARPAFADAQVFLGEHMGFNECHELAVVFPATISKEAFQAAAEELDQLSYGTANEMNVSFIIKDLTSHDATFRYRMLDRMRTDCEYYLGYGNRYAGHLWGGSAKNIIRYMKALWNSFPEDQKPEWLPYSKILEYDARMNPGKPYKAPMPDELVVRLAHLAGEMESDKCIEFHDWDSVCSAIQQVITAYNNDPHENFNVSSIEEAAQRYFIQEFGTPEHKEALEMEHNPQPLEDIIASAKARRFPSRDINTSAPERGQDR